MFVVKNHARVGSDSQFANELLPVVNVLVFGERLTPVVMIDPNRTGDVAGFVLFLGASIQNAKSFGDFRLRQFGDFEKEIGSRITPRLSLVGRSGEQKKTHEPGHKKRLLKNLENFGNGQDSI